MVALISQSHPFFARPSCWFSLGQACRANVRRRFWKLSQLLLVASPGDDICLPVSQPYLPSYSQGIKEAREGSRMGDQCRSLRCEWQSEYHGKNETISFILQRSTDRPAVIAGDTHVDDGALANTLSETKMTAHCGGLTYKTAVQLRQSWTEE